MTDLPDHRLRASRCPHVVNINGLLIRCSGDRDHPGDSHSWEGSDYLAAERAAMAAGWRQLRTDLPDPSILSRWG